MNIVIVCGFFDSTQESYRENQFAIRLAQKGHQVRVITSDAPMLWRYNRAGIAPNDPKLNDSKYRNTPHLTLERRRPYIRAGDFVLFSIGPSDFAEADVVHVLDCRQGITAFAARMAERVGKPVVIDHEQRGDRDATIAHRLDSAFRRRLIRIGARHSRLVRHTVIQNLDYFRATARLHVEPEYALAPLGVNDELFFADPGLRAATRHNLGLADGEYAWLMTGKIDLDKRPDEVALAISKLGGRLFVAGRLSSGTQKLLGELPHVTILGQLNQRGLNEIYNALDCAIFTTFTLSYWEALATGIHIMVPRTRFSNAILQDIPNATLFGSPSMFSIEEERYDDTISIVDFIADAASTVNTGTGRHSPPPWIYWDEKITQLEQQYSRLCSTPAAPYA